MASRRHRIFLKTGVVPPVDEEVLRTYFEQYGTVMDVYIPKDFTTKESRGFGYVSFEDEDGVEKALVEPIHQIAGNDVPVGRAGDRPADHVSGNRRMADRRGGGDYGGGAMSAGFAPQLLASGAPLGLYGNGVAQVAASRLGAGMGLDAMSRPLGAGPGLGVDLGLDTSYAASGAQFGSVGGFATGYEPNALLGAATGVYGDQVDLGLGRAARPRHPVPAAVIEDKGPRIFVGGIPPEITVEMMKEHFGKYGKVEDVYFPADKATGKRRNFCFVRLDSLKNAEAAAARSQRTIGGFDIGEIKVAEARTLIAGYGPLPRGRSPREGFRPY